MQLRVTKQIFDFYLTCLFVEQSIHLAIDIVLKTDISLNTRRG